MITKTPKLDRRSFVIGTAAVGAGLTLGLKIPFGTSVVRAQDGSPEINAWVVIRPDDARAERDLQAQGEPRADRGGADDEGAASDVWSLGDHSLSPYAFAAA